MIADAAGFADVFGVSRETLARLECYESLLRLWQKRTNLVAATSLADVWHRHFADSAQLVRLIPAGAHTVADLGSGAGFPGLVLAIMLAEKSERREDSTCQSASPAGARQRLEPGSFPLQRGKDLVDSTSWPAPQPPHRIALIESDGRKAAFLREAARQTGAAVEILSTRIENAETHARVGQVDVVTVRALAPLGRLLQLAAPYFDIGTIGLFLKGQRAQTEIEDEREQWSFGVDLVPSVTAVDARIAVIRNLRARERT